MQVLFGVYCSNTGENGLKQERFRGTAETLEAIVNAEKENEEEEKERHYIQGKRENPPFEFWEKREK